MEEVVRHAGHEGGSEEVEWISSSLAMSTHGALMVVAWLVCSNIGMAAGRYLRLSPKPYPSWFPIHIVLQVLAALLTFVGFIIIVMHVGSDEDPDHFASVHGVVGLLIFISMFVQLALGIVAHYTWTPAEGATVYDKWHWWAGRGLYLLSIANVLSGFGLLQQELQINGFIWFCFGMLLALTFLMTAGIEIYAFTPPAQAHSFEVLDDHAPAVEQANLGYEVDASNGKIFKTLTIYVATISIFAFAVVVGLYAGVSPLESDD